MFILKHVIYYFALATFKILVLSLVLSTLIITSSGVVFFMILELEFC